MDDAVRRRKVTPQETEEHILVLEEHLKTLSGDEAKGLQETISTLKPAVVGMRDGTVKIFHRIPAKAPPRAAGQD